MSTLLNNLTKAIPESQSALLNTLLELMSSQAHIGKMYNNEQLAKMVNSTATKDDCRHALQKLDLKGKKPIVKPVTVKGTKFQICFGKEGINGIYGMVTEKATKAPVRK